MDFSLNTETNLLDTDISGYCNGTKVEYQNEGNHVKFILGGGRTLFDCGEDEDIDFYQHMLVDKLYYEFPENQEGLWLWSDENHKIYFEQKTLITVESILDNAVTISPNPASNSLQIKVNATLVELFEIKLLDSTGRIIVIKNNNFTEVDI